MLSNITSLTQLDSTTVKDNIAYLAQVLQETHPNIDVSPGTAFYQLVLLPAASFHTMNQLDLATVLSSMSLASVTANEASVDPAIADGLLSNFLVTRTAASYATGQLTIVTTQLAPVTIPPTMVFTSATGLTFAPAQPYLGVTTEEALAASSNNRLIQPIGDGLYAFSISVTALVAGSASAIVRDTAFSVLPTIPNLSRIYAESDFVGGTDQESVASAVSRVETSMSAKSTADRSSIRNIITSQFSNASQLSIIGFGDPEMTRDRNNIMGISTVGKVDIYARTRPTPATVKFTKTAVLVDAANKVMQVSFSRYDYPGFYSIISVNDVGMTGSNYSKEIVADVRSTDVTATSDSDYVPVIPTVEEGAYSAYQTATIQFKDPGLDTSAMEEQVSTNDYDVYVSGMPSIDAIQAFVNDRSRRQPCGDYLVKAPIPCMVSLSIKVAYDAELETPDSATLKTAISDVVSGLDFSQDKLPASLIIKTVENLLQTKGAVELPIVMRGAVRLPDGSTSYIVSNDNLVVPTNYDLNTSRRTTAYYLPVENIDMTLVPAKRFSV